MNSTNSTVATMTADIIQEAYESYVYALVNFSATTLIFYATLTTFSREKEDIWFRPFSLPTLLYIFARYGYLIEQALIFTIDFIPLGRSCNIIADVNPIIALLPLTGVQGLLIIRAYSICQGNKILMSPLAFGLFARISLIVYGMIAFPGCTSSLGTNATILSFIEDIINISTDLLIFGIFMWKVWGIWRLKCSSGIQSSSSSLISVLLTQGILRCCFVVTIGIPNILITWLDSPSQVLFGQSYILMQNVLSATLVADFTLDLRRLNSAKIEASQISLPPLQLSNVLQRVHQSFLVEMATPEEIKVEEAGDDEHNNLPELDVIHAAEN